MNNRPDDSAVLHLPDLSLDPVEETLSHLMHLSKERRKKAALQLLNQLPHAGCQGATVHDYRADGLAHANRAHYGGSDHQHVPCGNTPRVCRSRLWRGYRGESALGSRATRVLLLVGRNQPGKRITLVVSQPWVFLLV
jgi:hypothetical protein